MSDEREFYRVVNDLYLTRLPDHLDYGYEFERDFRHALWRLVNRWRGRVGVRAGERHGFLLLRFLDTPGGRLDEAWLPPCLLERTDAPPYACTDEESPDDASAELDSAFGFQ